MSVQQARDLLKNADLDPTSNALVKRIVLVALTKPLIYYLKIIADLRVTTVTSKRDVARFHRTIFALCCSVLALTSWTSASDYLQKRLELSWRAALTRALHEKYLSGIRFYEAMNHKRKDLRVPDADIRITEDISKVTTVLSETLAGGYKQATESVVCSAIVATAGFAGLLQQGAGGVVSMLSSLLLIGGGVVLPQVLAPAGAAQASKAALSAWSGLQARLSRVQANDEQVCALRGGAVERRLADGALEGAVESAGALQRSTLGSEALQYLMLGIGLPGQNKRAPCATLAATIFCCMPYAAEMLRWRRADGSLPPRLGPEELSTELPGRFTQALVLMSYSGLMVQGLFATLQHLLALTSCSAQLDRLQELFGSLDGLEAEFNIVHATSFCESPNSISFSGVDITTPTGVPLSRNLTFRVAAGDSLLITGHNGAGKSSIFRVLGGLWPAAAGTISRPAAGKASGLSSQVYYLPQKPYSPLGTLLDLFHYPDPPPSDGDSTEELRRWLSYVDLADLVDRPGTLVGEHDWEQELSLGELQRISAARLFYQHPRFVILDECTSAVSFRIERRIFELCERLGISRLTIAHRPMLQDFHSKMLVLSGRPEDADGGWRLQELGEGTAKSAPGELGTEDRRQIVEDYLQHSGDRSMAACGSPKSHGGESLAREADGGLVPAEPASGILEQMRQIHSAVQLGSAGVSAARGRGLLLLLLCGARTAVNVVNFTEGLTVCIRACLTFDRMLLLKSGLRSALMGCLLTWLDCRVTRLTQSLRADLWRGLSRHLHKGFFSEDAFYRVRNQSPVLVSEPAQRLLESKAFVESFFSHVEDTLKPIMTMSVGSVLILRSLGSVGIYALAGTFAFGHLVTRVLMPDFARHQNAQADLLVKFKTVHARLKQHAEAIAFSGGIDVERRVVQGRFDTLTSYQDKMLSEECSYNFFKTLLTDSAGVPLIMLKYLGIAFVTTHFGEMSEGGAASAVNLQANFNIDRIVMNITFPFLSILAEVPENLARLSAQAARILELDAAFKKVLAFQPAQPEAGSPHSGSDAVEVRGLDLAGPGGPALAKGLSLVLEPGAHLMVTGQNASGKSSLGRVILGLWSGQGGKVLVRGKLVSPGSRPTSKDFFAVPQRPYLCHGLPLAAQLSYPEEAEVSDEALREVMSAVGLGHLLDRFDPRGEALPWQDVLSGGEQQRLGFARCLFHRPRFALLDDCSSMVSQEAEAGLYKAVLQRGITALAMSQRLTLPDIFPRELALGQDTASGWELRTSTGLST